MTPVTPMLWVLLTLFSLRVGAQLLQWLSPVPWLPPFESWHGAVLAYWQLLAFQLMILVWLSRIASRRTRGAFVPHAAVGRTLLLLGSLYATVVVVRFSVGALDLWQNEWFHRSIPAFFHAVLATWTLSLGFFHTRTAPAAEDPLLAAQTCQ